VLAVGANECGGASGYRAAGSGEDMLELHGMVISAQKGHVKLLMNFGQLVRLTRLAPDS